MTQRRCFTLLEVLVGLALLASLGVSLIQLQACALRQLHDARRKADVARRVEALLWDWSSSNTPVTLPATGTFDRQLAWRREVQPVRIAAEVLPIQVSLIVTELSEHAQPREIYRVDWLVAKHLKQKP